MKYSQPEFYRFSEDSIHIGNWTLEELSKRNFSCEDFKGADFGAGCGVVGLEFLSKLNKSITFDFIEGQESFESHFKNNRDQVLNISKEKVNFLNINLNEMRTEDYSNYYDLILTNPPYFNKNENRLGPSKERNHCRFFMDLGFEEWIEIIFLCLKVGGDACFSMRDFEGKKKSFLEEKYKDKVSFKYKILMDKTTLVFFSVLKK